MLQRIRDKAQGAIAWVIILILVAAFGLWGIQNYMQGGQSKVVAVTVNGHEITQQHLDQVYQRLQREKAVQIGDRFVMTQTLESQLKQQALQHVVMLQLLTDTAHRQGFGVSVQQVDETIQQMPTFQENGQFSEQRFEQILNVLLYEPVQFVNDVRSGLVIEQMQRGMSETSFVLNDEIAEAFHLIDERRNITYAVIPKSRFSKEATVSETTLKQYYQDHLNEFMKPATVSVEYVELSVPGLKKQFTFTNEELKNYYENNMDPKLPFEKVKPQAQSLLAQQKAEQSYASAIEKLADITFSQPKSLQPAAEALKLTVQTLPAFTESGLSNETLAKNPKFVHAAFNDDVLQGNNSEVIQLSNENAVVLRVKQYTKAQPYPFETVRPQIISRLTDKELDARAEKLGQAIVQALQSGKSQDAVAQQYQIHWQSADGVARHSTEPPVAILSEAFNLPFSASTKTLAVGGARLPEGYAVVIVRSVQPGAVPATANQDYNAFKDQLQRAFGQSDYNLYVAGVLERAKIKPASVKQTLKASL